MKRSSRLLAGLTAASLTLTALGGAAWAAEGDRPPLTVNGEATGITVEEQNGGYLVPVRRLAEYLGYTVEWHPEDGTVTLDSGSMHATLTLGVNSYQAVTSLEGMVGMTAPSPWLPPPMPWTASPTPPWSCSWCSWAIRRRPSPPRTAAWS